MEWMLLEIAEKIAQHLSPKDLSACCGVSVHWRQVFGSNQVWKRLCDPDKEAHLRTTPCVVQPAFSVPGDQGSTLAPVGWWRTAFLREQHLWSNWRHWRVKTVEHKVGEKVTFMSFVTDDFLMCVYEKSKEKSTVKLWNVKCFPSICTNTQIFNRFFLEDLVVYYNNNLLTIEYFCYVEILKINVKDGTLVTRYQVFYDEVKRHPVLVEQLRKFESHNENGQHVSTVITPRNKCIAYTINPEAKVPFNIWDLNNGEKLKEELSWGFSHCMRMTSCNTCEDVLVLRDKQTETYYVKENRYVECRVYNVEKLQFLKFNQMVHAFGYTDEVLDEISAMIKNFVALVDYDGHNEDLKTKTIRIFNYQTGHELHRLRVNVWQCLEVLNNSCIAVILYPRDEDIESQKALCIVEFPSGAIFQAVSDTCFSSSIVIGKDFVQIDSDLIDGTGIWKIDKSSTFKIPLNVFENEFVINQSCTRLVTDPRYERSFTISHFW